MRKLLLVTVAVTAALAASQALAANQPNDDLADATPISTADVTGSTAFATSQSGEPTHGPAASNATDSVWYRFSSNRAGTLELDVCAANIPFYLDAYTGSAVDQLTPAPGQLHLACPPARRLNPPGDRLRFDVAAGVTYSISVASADPGDGFTLKPTFTPAANPDTTAPETTIVKHPKKKAKKKKAKFTFTSSEDGSTFKCALNGADFAPCTSPAKVKAKKGKNKFAVEAIDSAGNVDGTPAIYKWKVKKKHKH